MGKNHETIMENGAKMAPQMPPKSIKNRYFVSILAPFWLHFGSLLAPFWIILAHFPSKIIPLGTLFREAPADNRRHLQRRRSSLACTPLPPGTVRNFASGNLDNLSTKADTTAEGNPSLACTPHPPGPERKLAVGNLDPLRAAGARGVFKWS